MNKRLVHLARQEAPLGAKKKHRLVRIIKLNNNQLRAPVIDGLSPFIYDCQSQTPVAAFGSFRPAIAQN